MEVPLVALDLEGTAGRVVASKVRLLRFRFLQADDVRLLRREPAEKALALRRADAVDVKGNDFQDDGKLAAPPCAADHSAGEWRNFSTSPICAEARYLPSFTTRSTSHQVARWCRRTPSSLIVLFDSGKMS